MNNDNLSLYSVFIAVADAGSILGASEKLFISQPAVSKSIKKLEANLSTSLFTRTSKGVSLTEEGQILYDNVSNAFEYIRQGEDNLKLRGNLGIGHIKIGVSTTLCKYVLLPYLTGYTRNNPHINISIECQSSGDTLGMLASGLIDIGLIAKPDNTSSVKTYDLGLIHDIFAATPEYINNMKMRDRGLSLSDYANVMMLNKENVTRQYVDRYVSESMYYGHNYFEIDSMDLLIEFAKTGIGIGCVIREFVKKELAKGKLIEIKEGLMPIPPRMVCFAHSSVHKTSKYVNDFLEYIMTESMNFRTNILRD